MHIESLLTRVQTPRPTAVPVSVYVLWHPSFAPGEPLAQEIHAWLQGSLTDSRDSGQGIPVHFRSAAWTAELDLDTLTSPTVDPGADPRLANWRRPIHRADADDNVVVPLVDDHMIEDPSWRRDLLELAREDEDARAHRGDERASSGRVHLLPVQLSAAWARLPPSVSKRNTLRLDTWRDSAEDDARRLVRWRAQLRRLVAQAIVRRLRSTARFPTQVFLSHAKRDGLFGPQVAEQLRDVAAGYGQIEVFYDENDLFAGDAWERPMLTAAKEGAGFIAVLSDAYASRYWCRREVEAARTPVREPPPLPQAAGEDQAHVWSVCPTVVALSMKGQWSRLVGDLATVPARVWDEKLAPEFLDHLFREALIAVFHRRYARTLHERIRRVVGPDIAAVNIEYLSFLPDVASIQRVLQMAGAGARPNLVVAYPGHGMLVGEAHELKRGFDAELTFTSFEALADVLGVAETAPRTWAALVQDLRDYTTTRTTPHDLSRAQVVALSAGDAQDLAALGYDAGNEHGSIHLDAAVFRVARAVLGAGHRIAYGGILRRTAGFTDTLLDAVSGSFAEVAGLDVADPPTPVLNFQAAGGIPVDVARKARTHGLCQFVDVPPRRPGAEGAWGVWDALATMRAAIAGRTMRTVAFAGKTEAFAGGLPGVAEEILAATEAAIGGPAEDRVARLERLKPSDVRVLLFGSFGGITRQVVRFLLGPMDAALPEPLLLEWQRERTVAVKEIEALGGEAAAELAARYAALAACLRGLRAVAHMAPETLLPLLGMTVADWLALMRTDSPARMRAAAVLAPSVWK